MSSPFSELLVLVGFALYFGIPCLIAWGIYCLKWKFVDIIDEYRYQIALRKSVSTDHPEIDTCHHDDNDQPKT